MSKITLAAVAYSNKKTKGCTGTSRASFIAGVNFVLDEFFAGRFRSILEEDKRFNDMLIKRSVANDLHIIAGNPSWFFNKYKDIKKENDK